jgi:hypothetical protein
LEDAPEYEAGLALNAALIEQYLKPKVKEPA